MSDAFEGDLIRPLGLVTLYCGYAEREADDLLAALSNLESFDSAKRQWTVGQKLTHAERLIRSLQRDDQLADLLEALAEARRLFEWRNTLVHGSLYAGGRLVSNRAGLPEQRVTAEDLTRFAEAVFSCKERIWLQRCKHLVPILTAWAGLSRT